MLTNTELNKIAQAMQKPVLLASNTPDLAWSVLLAGRYVKKAAIIKGDEYAFKANPSANHALKHLDNYAVLWLDNGDMLLVTPTVTGCCFNSRFSEFFIAQAASVGDSNNRIVNAYITKGETYGAESYNQYEFGLCVDLENSRSGVTVITAMHAYELEHNIHAFEARLIKGESPAKTEPARALALLELAKEHRLLEVATVGDGFLHVTNDYNDLTWGGMLRKALRESGITDLLEADLNKWLPKPYRAVATVTQGATEDIYAVSIEKDLASDDDSQ